MDLASAPQIQVPFTVPATDTLGAYSDTLFFTATEYQALTDADLAAAKQARYEAWVTVVTTPPPPPPPPLTVAEAAAQIPALLVTADGLVAEHQALIQQLGALGPIVEQLAQVAASSAG